MKPYVLWKSGRALAAAFMATSVTALSLMGSVGVPVVDAHSAEFPLVSGTPLCAPAATSANEHVNLSATLAADPDPTTVAGPPAPSLGWWTTHRSSVNTRRCVTYSFELEPGAEVQPWLRLVPVGPVTTSEDLASAVARCSWQACLGLSRLHESSDANVWRSLPKVGHATTEGARRLVSFEVLGIGRATLEVVLTHGALPSPYQNAQGTSPMEVPSAAAKVNVTGQSDHSWYPDSSALGQDACILKTQQFDADQPGDAGDTAEDARIIPLGTYPLLGTPPTPSNRIRFGQRGLFINGRVGDGDRPGSACAPAGGSADNDDWYSLTVQPGAQAVINLWPTRYDYYGGGLQYRLIRLIPTGGTRTAGAPLLPANEVPASAPAPAVLAGPAYSGGELLCNGETSAPNEPVFNPALQCGRTVAYVPHVNSGVRADLIDPNAVPTTYLLHVRGQGFVRYSMTVDYLGDLLPETPGVERGAGPLQ